MVNTPLAKSSGDMIFSVLCTAFLAANAVSFDNGSSSITAKFNREVSSAELK